MKMVMEKDPRNFEKRYNRRAICNKIAQERKDERKYKTEQSKLKNDLALKWLKQDKLKAKSTEKKRPGPEKFLPAFSYISWTPSDKRSHIPFSYCSRSFNERRQYIDFFKEFIYPYKVPQILLLASLENERMTAHHMEIIKKAKKWVCDIVSGASFFKQNKEYFTHAEAHLFLNTDKPYKDLTSVIDLFFYSKCLARRMSIPRSRFVSKTFTIKFIKDFNHPLVTGFLDLIARSSAYEIENTDLGDICDFVLDKIKRYRKANNTHPPFSFSGRTMESVIGLANEWHADIQKEQEALNELAREGQQQGQKYKTVEATRWNGIPVYQSTFKEKDCEWSFVKLCSVQDLVNEGRIMKNCAASYSSVCTSGMSTIFHLARDLPEIQIHENIATLEVSKERVLIQAKEKYNKRISPTVEKIIRKWGQQNRIKIEGYSF
jgi:hypothetical protein